MDQATGIISKITNNQYRLVTMQGELLIEGNLAVNDGFNANIDLSGVLVKSGNLQGIVKSGVFNMTVPSYEKIGQCDCSPDCECECSVPDDCSNPNDCDCDCAEP